MRTLFNKTKYITVSATPINHFAINNIHTYEHRMEESNCKVDMFLFEHKNYTVRKNCTVKLTGYIEANTEDIIIASGEEFCVKSYTGYDLYGEDHIIYLGKEYILHWDSTVLKSLMESLYNKSRDINVSNVT